MFNAYQRICAAAFILSVSTMVGGTATPFFVFHQVGGGATMSGLFGAAQAAAYGLVCLLSAGFVARARNGMVWAITGVTGYAVFYSMMPLFRNPVLCGSMGLLANAAIALAWPALHSWIGAEPDPDKRSRHMVGFNLSWSMGCALGPLLAGPLYDTDYRLPFATLFGLNIATLLLLRSLPHERDYFAAPTQEFLAGRAEHDRVSETFLYAAWCATFVTTALIGATRSVYPKRVNDLVVSGELRLFFEQTPAAILGSAPATKYSWIAFALALTTSLTFIVMGHTTRWRHRFGLLAGLQGVAAGAFWVLGHTRSLAVMAGCFVLVGAAYGATFFASAYHSLANAEHKHRRAAINEAAVGAGGLAGSMGFGCLAGWYGLGMPFLYTPVFIAAAIAVQMVLLRRTAPRLRPSRVSGL